MADTKISALTALTGATIATNDILPIVDTSAVETKGITVTELLTGVLGSTSITGAIVTASQPLIDVSQTWNNAAVTFTGMRFNAAGTSDANSNAASLLMDLQVGGSSRFSVGKGTAATTVQNATATFQIKTLTETKFQTYFTSPAQVALSSDMAFGWVNTTNASGTNDLNLTRRGAANLRFGAADAAAPVAQILSVQSVVAGTSNTAGAAFTITGSQGTGSGAGGSIIFQVAPAGAAPTVQNALSTALTIASTRAATFAGVVQLTNGTAAAAALRFAGGAGSGIYSRDGYTTNITDGGGTALAEFGGSGLGIRTSGIIGWGTQNDNTDLRLNRDDADALALRRTTNAQAFRVYNTYTSATSFERFNIFAQAAAAVLIGTEKGSAGGTARALEIQTDATSRLTLDTVGSARIVTALTVATLPGTPLTGMMARVTDALAPAVGVTVAAGGAAQALCWYNGANWTVIGI